MDLKRWWVVVLCLSFFPSLLKLKAMLVPISSSKLSEVNSVLDVVLFGGSGEADGLLKIEEGRWCNVVGIY